MEKHVIHVRPDIRLNREHVFSMMDCHEQSPVYEEVVGAYERLSLWLYSHVRPTAVIAWEPARQDLIKCLALKNADMASPEAAYDTGQKDAAVKKITAEDLRSPAVKGLLYLVMTLGIEPERYSGTLFDAGEYLEGMLMNTMADEYLFMLEDVFMPEIRKICAIPGFGVLRRLEAPGDIPLEFHRYIYDQCGLRQTLGMELSSGFMFSPVKTSCVVFELTDDPHVFNASHDCSHCTAMGCRRRKESAGKGRIL